MRERQSAAYVVAKLEADRWSGNVGLRFVRTRVNAQVPIPLPTGACARSAPNQPAIPCAAFPTALTTVGEGVQLYATNLTNVKRAYYRYSEEEQQKLDVSGRQLILAHSVRQRTVGRPVPTYDEAV
jgi:iron complex outermembrane receptor protein